MNVTAFFAANDATRATRLTEIARVGRAVTRALSKRPTELRTARRELSRAKRVVHEAPTENLHVADNMIRDVAVRFAGEAPLGWYWDQSGSGSPLMLRGETKGEASASVTAASWSIFRDGESAEGTADSIFDAKRTAIQQLREHGWHGMGAESAEPAPVEGVLSARTQTSIDLTVIVEVTGTTARMLLNKQGQDPYEIARGTWDGLHLHLAANPGETHDESDTIFEALEQQLRAAAK